MAIAAASLEHRAEVQVEELEAELAALRAEEVAFATRIRSLGLRAAYGAVAHRLDVIRTAARDIVAAADRHLKQRNAGA